MAVPDNVPDRFQSDLIRARAYLDAARPSEHKVLGLDEDMVVAFGEPQSIYHGRCTCGYRTLGFADAEAAIEATMRHVANMTARG